MIEVNIRIAVLFIVYVFTLRIIGQTLESEKVIEAFS